VEALEKRVADLEKQVKALSKASKPAAAKPAARKAPAKKPAK
jgi:O-acetylhomoserine/O-acetylserine sulfhydrylase-like pyridoxal-dependent enzyme